jgi:hypothetical protein
MVYGRIEGRFREIRVGPVDPNMGGARPPVKSTDVESPVGDIPITPKKL